MKTPPGGEIWSRTFGEILALFYHQERVYAFEPLPGSIACNDESTGLMYYGARYYDPALGRFISADTIVPDPANPQNLNRYAYVRNNPLKYTDPSGHGAYDAWEPGAGGAPIGAYKRAFGIYGYPMPDELYEAFEAGYHPFFDPDNFLISEDGTVLVRGAGNDVYFQEYYHWAFDTGSWLPLPQDLRHDVFAYWTVVQAGVSVLKPTDWKDIAVQGVGCSAVFAGATVANLLGRSGGGDSPVVVVGQTMSRVEKAAEQLRRQGLDVRTYNPREGTRNLMEANRSWLRYWTKVKQATVVDIGTDSNRTVPSDFYAMENRSLYVNWQYENVVQWDPGF